MKRINFLTLFFMFSCLFGEAQNVGIGTNRPQAALDVTSTTNGFLPPRMTFSQRNSINNPSMGLMIFCIDCDSSGQPQFFNGIRWCNMMGGLASLPITIPPYVGKWNYQYIRDTFYNWRELVYNGQFVRDSSKIIDVRTTGYYFQFNANNTYTWQRENQAFYTGSYSTETSNFAYGLTLKCLGIYTNPPPNDTTRFYIYTLNSPNMTLARDLFGTITTNGDTIVIDRYYDLLKE